MKNEHFLDMLDHAKKQVGFRYVLGDSWFSLAATINFVTSKLAKHAVLAVRTSRTVALSDWDSKNGKCNRIDQVSQLELGQLLSVYLRSVPEPVQLIKQVFTNKDGNQGTLYLTCDRSNDELRRHHYDLQKTVESRGVSQCQLSNIRP